MQCRKYISRYPAKTLSETSVSNINSFYFTYLCFTPFHTYSHFPFVRNVIRNTRSFIAESYFLNFLYQSCMYKIFSSRHFNVFYIFSHDSPFLFSFTFMEHNRNKFSYRNNSNVYRLNYFFSKYKLGNENMRCR